MRIVTHITVEAYFALSNAGNVRSDWEEDAFTVNLEDYIREIAYRSPLNLQVKSRTPVYTEEMRTGTVSMREAKIIDLQLWGQWHQYAEVYFAWECKLVADRRQHDRDLINEYIKNGMFRFLDGHYSARVADAGMLGYVLAGEVTDIVGQINDSMLSPQRDRQLREADKLAHGTPVGTFGNVYMSSHARSPNLSAITLHHLFLTFDFSEN